MKLANALVDDQDQDQDEDEGEDQNTNPVEGIKIQRLAKLRAKKAEKPSIKKFSDLKSAANWLLSQPDETKCLVIAGPNSKGWTGQVIGQGTPYLPLTTVVDGEEFNVNVTVPNSVNGQMVKLVAITLTWSDQYENFSGISTALVQSAQAPVPQQNVTDIFA